MRSRRLGLLFLLGLTLVAAACGRAPETATVAGAIPGEATVTGTRPPAAISTPRPSPTAQAPGSAVNAARPALPTPLATVTQAATATPEPTASPTTPAPTFTPPPPPPPSTGEHLIFGRPVPAAFTQWTDKAYPYGSTRGGTLQPHHGVEFAVPIGTPVLAAAGGTVRVAGPDDQVVYGPQPNFYGNVIIIEHTASPNGLALYTVYGHLSEVQVAPGQSVAAGEQLGLSGDAGVAYGPHLHFEVREGANTYLSTRNPLLWLRPFDGTGVVAGRVTFANSQPAHEVPITLRRVDGAAPYTAGTSYAQSPVNGDLIGQENFALDDVVAGYYEITAGVGQATTSQTLWVFPGRANLVTLVLP
jgi:murein DD-endopeptidase MepM/ murein hydrolase activator NlpD